jgi:polyhydroxyalkanoate synthesis regulator phasin
MSVEQHQQALLESYNGSDDPLVKEAAQTANQYTEMFKAGQLSKEEYTQVMQDIVHANNINQSVANQQFMEHMNTAINGLVNLASLV